MFGLGSHEKNRTCGVVIDIGSGSVGAAIVISDREEPKPEIIWSKREFVLIKNIDSTEVPLKEITTSLVNIFLQLGSDGMKALATTDKSLSIEKVQVTISSPWTYTVTKTINFTDEHPFIVDDEFIKELSNTAQKQAFTAVIENKVFQESQLGIIDNKTVGISINGYPVASPKNIKTREVSLAHITAITQNKILKVLEDSKNKLIPKATLSTHSFLYMFYDVLKHMNPDTAEACLVDVTSESTEIGIIRDGTLTHVTHLAFGTFSIAREIAALAKIPNNEAYTYLKGGLSSVETKLSAPKAEELTTILESYEDKVAELFKITGDSLAIPKTIFLHTELATEAFFTKHISAAATKATSMHHNIHPITSILFENSQQKDTALLLSAHYFHREHVAMNI